MPRVGTFKCAVCGRSFGMAAHLGRHMHTIHGTKRAHPVRRGHGRVRVVGGDSGPGFLREVRTWRDELMNQREQINAQLAALDTLLGTLA